MPQTIPANIVEAAQGVQRKYRIPASVSIAQWAVESGWGKYMPEGSNNPFGLKVRNNQNDPFVLSWTKEVIKGKTVSIKAKFRKFASLDDAFLAKGSLVATAPVYAKAFAKLPDTNAFIDAFAPIYATDPNYAKLLKTIISQNKLTKYDG